MSIRLPKTKVGYKSFYKILDVSKELFSTQGYSTTSVNQIIEKSGVAIGTFYIYFDDKRAVYNFLLQRYSKDIKSNIAEAIKDLPTRYEQERVGLKTFIKYTLKDRLSYRIIWESFFIERELFVNYYKDFSNSYIRQLNRAVNKNEVKKDIDLETLSYVLMGIANFVGLQAQFKDASEEEIDHIVDNVMKILKEGMFI